MEYATYYQVKQGLGLSRASNTLRSDESQNPRTSETLERLKPKFPRRRPSEPQVEPVASDDPAPKLAIEPEDMEKMIRKLINGSSGGRSRLRGEHILPLLEDPVCVDALTGIICHLANGTFPDWSHPYMVSLKLMALGEKFVLSVLVSSLPESQHRYFLI